MIPFLRTLNCFTSRRSRPRRSGRPTRYASTACVQALESRQLLTGTVSLAITAAGDVSITGDSKANLVEIEIRNGDIFVTGTQGTSLNFGRGLVPADQEVSLAAVLAASTPPGTLPNPLTFRNLSINMGTGDDTVIISASEDVDLTGNASINLGTGQNTLILATGADFDVAGSFSVTGDKGHDLVALVTTGAGRINVDGNLNIATGRGNDSILLGNADPAIALVGNADVAAAFLALTGTNGNPDSVTVGGNMTVSTGSDDDRIGILDVNVGGDARLDNGLGHGDIMLMNNFDVGRNLTLHYGDLHGLQDVNVTGRITVTSGTGDDILAFNQISTGSVNIDLGSGKDVLAAIGGATVTTSASVTGGTGRDTFVGTIPAGLNPRGFEASSTLAAANVNQFIASTVNSVFAQPRLAPLTGIIQAIQGQVGGGGNNGGGGNGGGNNGFNTIPTDDSRGTDRLLTSFDELVTVTGSGTANIDGFVGFAGIQAADTDTLDSIAFQFTTAGQFTTTLRNLSESLTLRLFAGGRFILSDNPNSTSDQNVSLNVQAGDIVFVQVSGFSGSTLTSAAPGGTNYRLGLQFTV